MQLSEKVFNAGVVGAGGAGFPTHVKLQSKVEIVIANGAECEPLLSTDRRTMVHFADEIVAGLEFLMESTGAREGILGVKEKYEDAVEALEKAIKKKKNLRVLKLGNYYPAGDEHSLVREATGRLIPEGGIPLNVGVVVNNVNTLRNVYRACELGKPVTHQILTVNGEIKEPKVLNVPVGISYREVIELCGGATIDDFTLIIGGPMMGRITKDLDQPVTKTTSGIILLPSDHGYVMRKSRSVEEEIRWSQSQCEACRDCTEFCPRWLQGHAIEPHKIMRVIDYNLDSEPHAKTITSAFLCCECGICDMFACPMNLSPRVIYKEFKRRMMEDGLRNPHSNDDIALRSLAEYRQVPKDRLLQRLDMGQYDCYPDFDPVEREADRVVIPLQQHIGAPAIPVVKVGDAVKKGDLIGDVPEGKLGAKVHASINGKILHVANGTITISAI